MDRTTINREIARQLEQLRLAAQNVEELKRRIAKLEATLAGEAEPAGVECAECGIYMPRGPERLTRDGLPICAECHDVQQLSEPFDDPATVAIVCPRCGGWITRRVDVRAVDGELACPACAWAAANDEPEPAPYQLDHPRK